MHSYAYSSSLLRSDPEIEKLQIRPLDIQHSLLDIQYSILDIQYSSSPSCPTPVALTDCPMTWLFDTQ